MSFYRKDQTHERFEHTSFLLSTKGQRTCCFCLNFLLKASALALAELSFSWAAFSSFSLSASAFFILFSSTLYFSSARFCTSLVTRNVSSLSSARAKHATEQKAKHKFKPSHQMLKRKKCTHFGQTLSMLFICVLFADDATCFCLGKYIEQNL